MPLVSERLWLLTIQWCCVGWSDIQDEVRLRGGRSVDVCCGCVAASGPYCLNCVPSGVFFSEGNVNAPGVISDFVLCNVKVKEHND